MRARRPITQLLLALAMAAGGFVAAVDAAEPVRVGRNEALEIAGRQVRCDEARARLDRRLPNLGAALPDSRVLLLNPLLLGRYSAAVQLFVFHHECGHIRVGDSEIRADCWAVEQGVRDGWLDRRGLDDVCRSFGNAPETDTHPSARRRCAALDQCFAGVERAVASRRDGPGRSAEKLAASRRQALPEEPSLVAGPQLLWTRGR